MTTDVTARTSTDPDGVPDGVPPDDAAQVRLALAARLARRGHYAEAREVLREFGGRRSTDPRVLDLLARIHAQEGDLDAAEACWAAAELLDPEAPGASAGRRRVAALRAQSRRPLLGRTALLATTVAALAAVVVLTVRDQDRGSDPSVAHQFQALQSGQQDLARQLGAIPGQVDSDDARRAQSLAALRTALAGTGFSLQEAQGRTTVVFPAAVFASGTSLSAAGRSELDLLATRVKAINGSFTIQVVGQVQTTTPTAAYIDPGDPGMALSRAEVAAQELATAGGLPLSTFQLSAAAPAEAPFPPTDPQSARRNRTVTVVFQPR